jgi:signal transduction histidine kinase
MFTSLRLNLTGKFLILSLAVYVIVSVISAFFFNSGLTQSLDEQLEEIYAVIIPSIEIGDDDSLSLRNPPRQMRIATNITVSPTVTLFDSDKKMCVQHGPKGSALLLRSGMEVRPESSPAAVHLRTLAKPIYSEGELVGYVQIQLSTGHREHAIREFLMALAGTVPLLLLTLAAAGYIFASRAIKPIEDTFALLKRFMSDAGHELKTPIAVIISSCDNLAADLEGNQQACERLEVISRSADRMERLVADLLLLTKSEQQALALKVIPLRFDMLLREVLGEFADLFEEKGIELCADDIHVAKVNGDRDALHRTLSNLLENALNYTDGNGRVTVSLSISGSSLILRIADTGIGIPPACQARIFERFYRVDDSRSRAAGGAGLGLSIVKAIVESHHGQIGVASEVGNGSTFTITLPAAGQPGLFGRRLESGESA